MNILRAFLLLFLSFLLCCQQGLALSTPVKTSPWLPYRANPDLPRITIAPEPSHGKPAGLETWSSEALLKKADEEISNLHLSTARACLNIVLKRNPADAQAKELLTFVDYLGRKQGPAKRHNTFLMPDTASLSVRDLLQKASDAISDLNLIAARELIGAALKKNPQDKKGREMLALVDFLEGKEHQRLDQDRSPDRLLAGINAPEMDTYTGYFYRESDSGVIETTSTLETTLDKFRWPGLSGGLSIEGHGYEVNEKEAKSQVIGTKLNYAPSTSHLVSVSFSPEVFDNDKTVNQFGWGVYSKVQTYRLGFELENSSFRDNLYTIQERMQRRDMNFSVSRKLTKRLEIRQRILWGTISDSNTSLSYDSRLKYRFLPGLAMDLKYYQSSHDFQMDEDGDSLGYWAPKNYRSVSLTLGWKKRASKKWKYEVETSFSGSGTTEYAGDEESYNAGVGILLHTGYVFSTGEIGVSYADKVYLSAREKRFNLGGTMRFF